MNPQKGQAQALDNAHPDTMPAVHRWLEGRAAGTTFTAAQMAEELPPHTVDTSVRLASVIGALSRSGRIRFAGYGPSRSHGDWGRPARVWEVVDVAEGAAA